MTTRSVLIYVSDKAGAFAAMHRVLRPGGRLSLFEPINRLTSLEPPDRFWGYDVGAVRELAGKVKAGRRGLEDPAVAAMTDFDDRDLVALAEKAGFQRIHMECHIDIEPSPAMLASGLDVLLDTAPNPLAPTIRESIAEALTAPGQERFLAHLGRAISAGEPPIRRSALAYLAARRAPA